METNHFGPINVIAAFTPILTAIRGGATVNMDSVIAGTCSQNASKAALRAATNAFTFDVASKATRYSACTSSPSTPYMARSLDIPKSSPQFVGLTFALGAQ